MALFRRNKTWWTDFAVNGARYRHSLKTKDWREAQAREKELVTQASVGKLAPSSQQFARLAFTEAADRYIEDRTPHLAPRSVDSEERRLKPMRAFFGATPLTRIKPDSVRQYIVWRKEGGFKDKKGKSRKIENRTVNMEIGVLSRILRRAKRWYLMADELRPLPERRDVGRALSNDEKVKLVKAAGSKPEWQVARLAMTLALNTTMRSCEIRGLRWRDVDFMERTVTIRRSKTEAGQRVIPLNADAWAAILELRERATLLLGLQPELDWYVFPHGEGQGPRIGTNKTTVKPDPTRPMSTWRTAWRKLSAAAGLKGLRFHDLRHHAITELAESQASDQTVRSIAGHVSQRMLEHYSHVRLEAKRKALDSLSSGGTGGSYGTNHGTNSQREGVPHPQVIERNGGADGTRTRDLVRDRHAF